MLLCYKTETVMQQGTLQSSPLQPKGSVLSGEKSRRSFEVNMLTCINNLKGGLVRVQG